MYLKLLLPAGLLLGCLCTKAQGLIIQPGTTFTATSNVNIVVQNGNLVNNGNGNFSGGNISLIGAAEGTVSGSTNIAVINLYIDKPSSTAYLGRNVDVAGSVVLQNGLLDLNNRTLSLAPTALIVGENETNRIIGPSGGIVTITLNMDAPLGDNPGNLGALLASTKNLGSVTIQRGHGAQKNNGTGKSIQRYYVITPSNNNSLNAIFRFKYLDAELNGLNENNLQMWKSNNNGSTWSSIATGGKNTSLNFVDVANVNVFSRFTLSSTTFSKNRIGPLIANDIPGKVQLTWRASTRPNNSSFRVERSNDGVQWYAIGGVPAKQNGFADADYSYFDINAQGETAYYRVQAIEDGAATNIAIVTRNGKIGSIALTPNPVQAQGTVTINAAATANSILKVYAADGRLVLQQQAYLLKGINQININVNNLAKGTYYLQVELKDGTKKNIPFMKN